MGIYRGWKPGSAYQPEQRPERTAEQGPAPVHLRKAQPAVTSLPRTVARMASLPESDRPTPLAKQYARIANMFATLWSRPEECRRYFDELLIDQRAGRKDFRRMWCRTL